MGIPGGGFQADGTKALRLKHVRCIYWWSSEEASVARARVTKDERKAR